MIINSANLQTLYTSFNAAYQKGFAGVTPLWGTIATEVKSSTAANEYGWLGSWPKLREWIGDRVVNNIASHGYTIKNRKFEGTVSVKADDIEDDQFGVYAPLFQEMGRASATHPDELVFEALKSGVDALCYDKLPFFSANHKVGKKNVSNLQDGNKPAWFLLDCSRSLKPLVYQNRKPYRLIRKDDPQKSDKVFETDEFRYGVDCRASVGFGFWQMGFASKADLTRENLRAAYTALAKQEDENGKKLGVKATHIIVPTALEFAARDLVLASVNAAGATNTDYKLVEVVSTSYLD